MVTRGQKVYSLFFFSNAMLCRRLYWYNVKNTYIPTHNLTRIFNWKHPLKCKTPLKYIDRIPETQNIRVAITTSQT